MAKIKDLSIGERERLSALAAAAGIKLSPGSKALIKIVKEEIGKLNTKIASLESRIEALEKRGESRSKPAEGGL